MSKSSKFFLAALLTLLAGAAWAGHGVVPPYPNFGLPRTEEMMFLVIQIGVIIFAAKLGGMAAQKAKLPSILGELAAGIVIGPWALGGIGFGDGMFAEGLFHGGALRALAAEGQAFDATSPALYGIATLASIILLFLSGLETNLKMFLKYSFVGSMVGVGGVVVSFILGDVCAVVFLPKFFPAFAELAQMPFSSAMMKAAPLYMGIMSTATSVGITARILSEKKKMDSEEGTTIMAGAVIDDVLGLIVLAIGNGIIATSLAAADGGQAGGMDWGNIGLVAVKAFGVWLGATLIGVLAARYIARFLKVSFKNPVVISTMAFGLSMVLAGIFEYMGLAMIIGAYVMGLALSRTDLKHTIQESLDPVYTFLVPIFFCVMGMMVDVTQLCSGPVLLFGAIYTILAVVAKVVGCMVPAMFCGFNALGGLRIGAGMVPRGEVALIIAGIGLSAGFLTQEIFGIGIMMTLITTVVAPPALVGLFAPKARGVRRPNPSASDSRETAFELSSPEVADYILTKLVAEFRTEGFFTSLLSKEENIWEVVMDDMEMSIRRSGSRILVQCSEAEEAMLVTAWMEVASQVNDLAKSISKPMRADTMGKLLRETQSHGSVARGAVRNVLRYVQGFVMLPSFKAANKEDAIRKIVAAIAKENPNHVKDVAAATEAVLRREASMPTGLDHGIAVPHGRDPSVTSIAGAVAILDNDGTSGSTLPDYETIDKSPVKIIVLTLANTQSQTPYLQLMSSISRVLRADEGYAMLAACKSADGMRRFFRGAQQS